MIWRMLDAIQAAVGAARAVMDGRHPVLVDDVLAAEGCSCSTPRVVVVHNRDTGCGDPQDELVYLALPGALVDRLGVTDEVLDVLAHEADRRDGVRRGPR